MGAEESGEDGLGRGIGRGIAEGLERNAVQAKRHTQQESQAWPETFALL